LNESAVDGEPAGVGRCGLDVLGSDPMAAEETAKVVGYRSAASFAKADIDESTGERSVGITHSGKANW
jgi:hypothetical protein